MLFTLPDKFFIIQIRFLYGILNARLLIRLFYMHTLLLPYALRKRSNPIRGDYKASIFRMVTTGRKHNDLCFFCRAIACKHYGSVFYIINERLILLIAEFTCSFVVFELVLAADGGSEGGKNTINTVFVHGVKIDIRAA